MGSVRRLTIQRELTVRETVSISEGFEEPPKRPTPRVKWWEILIKVLGLVYLIVKVVLDTFFK
jgi:hypothetical protein